MKPNRRNDKDGLKTTRCGEIHLHCTYSDHDISKIINKNKNGKVDKLNKVPDHAVENLALCSVHLTVDLFTKKAHFFALMKVRCYIDLIGS